MEHKYNYRVIENNGGGLSLFVFWGGSVIYSHSEYEYNPGQLSQDLDELDKGTEIPTWEGNSENPQDEWNDLHDNYAYGWKIVVSGGGGKRKLHKNRMDRAAQIEFGVTDEERDAAISAAQLGALGGKVKSERKAAAVRENGKRGGWPKGRPRK